MVEQATVEQIQVPLHLHQPSWVVRRQAHRCSIRVQLTEHLHQRLAAFRIEIPGRFIGNQNGRTSRDCPRDGDRLLVPARQRSGPLLCAGCQSNTFERGVNASLSFASGDSA